MILDFQLYWDFGFIWLGGGILVFWIYLSGGGGFWIYLRGGLDFQLYWDFGFIYLYTAIFDLFKVWFWIFNCAWILELFDLWGVSNCDHYWLFSRPVKNQKKIYVWFVVFLNIRPKYVKILQITSKFSFYFYVPFKKQKKYLLISW